MDDKDIYESADGYSLGKDDVGWFPYYSLTCDSYIAKGRPVRILIKGGQMEFYMSKDAAVDRCHELNDDPPEYWKRERL